LKTNKEAGEIATEAPDVNRTKRIPEIDRARSEVMGAGDSILSFVPVQQQPSGEQGVDVCVGRRLAILVVV
jgi:hypothetical protein